MRSIAGIALGLICVLWMPGCGDGRSAVPVGGKVTVKGRPLADIAVNFEPVGEGFGAIGKTDDQGNYSLQFTDTQQPGAAVGRHQVTFRDLLDRPAQDSDAGAAPPSKSRLPAASRSAVLEFNVPEGGTNAADFDLK